jgi:arylsulfatase A-like enzyme
MSDMTPSRRDFIKTSLTAGAALTASRYASASGQVFSATGKGRKRRPNILWIQTDEQRPDSLGCYGSAWAKTPHIDRLARQGTVFHECHVQSPTCIPSRTSMLACKYPQELNILANFGLDGKTVTNQPGYVEHMKFFPNLFADAGYRTANIGKWHTPRHDTWQHNDLYILDYDVADFDHLKEGYNEEEHRVVKRPNGRPLIMGGIYPDVDGGTTPSSHITDKAIDWLKTNGTKEDRPFLLRVSHLWPHTPVLVPRPWDTLYRPDEVPVPSRNRQKRMFKERSEFDQVMGKNHGGFEFSDEQWRQNAADYYGLCSHVDDEVGRLLRTLDELGLAEDTIIAFNADHGRNMGEVGKWEKGNFDSEVWRVPFILSWPGHIPEGEHRHDLLEYMDFGPTICSLAGIPLASGMRGRDLFNSQEPDAVFGIVRTWNLWTRASIRTEKYRYDCTFVYHGQFSDRNSRIEEGNYDPNLFDLDNDPMEENNLIHNPEMADVAQDLHRRLEAWYRRYNTNADG